MKALDKFLKVEDKSQLPTEGLFIILTKSDSFLARAIQGFMRLFQWTSGIKDTDLVPNHADGLNNGYGIGALALGVDGNDISSHFSNYAKFYVIKPILTKKQEDRFWKFMLDQQKERYAYFDLIKYAVLSLTHKWFGKPHELDRKKWTCYSLVASAYNYAVQEDFFEDPYKITPYEVCVILGNNFDIKFK